MIIYWSKFTISLLLVFVIISCDIPAKNVDFVSFGDKKNSHNNELNSIQLFPCGIVQRDKNELDIEPCLSPNGQYIADIKFSSLYHSGSLTIKNAKNNGIISQRSEIRGDSFMWSPDEKYIIIGNRGGTMVPYCSPHVWTGDGVIRVHSFTAGPPYLYPIRFLGNKLVVQDCYHNSMCYAVDLTVSNPFARKNREQTVCS